MKSSHLLLLSFALICSLAACKKDKAGDGPLPSGNKIKTTITGQVVDQTGSAVSDVILKVGSLSQQSDVNGMFIFKNIEVEKGRVFVAASKEGYFKSGRNLIPFANEISPALIMMVPLKVAGNISATAGGAVTSSDGLEVSLPANAIKGGYSGAVAVAVHLFDPTSEDFLLEVPGSLEAINSGGEEGILRSYAMANIELMDNQGNKLEIADGQKASLKFPIQPSLQASATATMPLWSFDEEEGIWKEEGIGTRNGNFYEADVPHFSPWNIDIFECSILIQQTVGCDSANLKNALLKMLRQSDQSASGFISTNNSGTYWAAVPCNAKVDVTLVQSYGQNHCSSLLGTITTGSTSENLGKLNACPPVMKVKGSVVDCNNAPVTNGYVMGSIGSFRTLGAVLDGKGKFELSTYFCPGASQLKLTAWDISSFSFNDDVNLTIEDKTENLASPIKICNSQASIKNTAYFSGADDNFYGVNSITGAVLWQTDPGNGISSRAPAFENGIFYLANGNKELCAINAVDGAIIWSKAILASSYSPLADNGVVYIGTRSGKVYALDGVSGNEIWSYDTDVSGSNSVDMYSSPTIHNGVLYIGTSTQKIIGLDINNGQLVWSFFIDKDAVYSNPAIANGKVILTSFGSKGILYAVNVQDSAEAWRVNVDEYMADPATDANNVFLHTDDALEAYDLTDGSLAWSYAIGGSNVGSAITTAPLVEGGKVYFGGREGKMKCLDAATGSLLWDYSVSSGVVHGSPALADGLLYFTGTHFDNKIYALKASDGTEVWTYPVSNGGAYRSGMVVIDQNGDAHYSSISGKVQ